MHDSEDYFGKKKIMLRLSALLKGQKGQNGSKNSKKKKNPLLLKMQGSELTCLSEIGSKIPKLAAFLLASFFPLGRWNLRMA